MPFVVQALLFHYHRLGFWHCQHSCTQRKEECLHYSCHPKLFQFLKLQNESSFKIKIHWSLIWNYWESVTNSTATIEVTYKCYSSGVLTPILGLIATIGIIFTITMQSRPKFKDCFLKLLISLACCGSIIITCRVINHTCRIFDAGASIYTDIAQKTHIATQTILYMNGVGVQDF